MSRRFQFTVVVLVALYLALGSAWAWVVPMFEKPDEPGHFRYVRMLAQLGQLPPLVKDSALNPAEQIAGHPPLFYALAAGVVRGLGLTLPSDPPLNPFWAFAAPGAVPDNKNLFIHTTHPVWSAALVTRLVSLVLGAGTVVGAAALAWQLTGQARLSVLTAALVAVHPQYLFIASSTSNDALVTALSTWALWAAVRLFESPSTARGWWLFGVLGGLAAIAKTSAALLPVLGMLLAVWLAWRTRQWRPLVHGVAASLGGWLLLAGGWYLRNLLNYGDPLGTTIHMIYGARAASLSLAEVPRQFEVLTVTFWATFGWSNVQLSDWVYRVFYVVQPVWVGLALWALWRHRSAPLLFVVVYVALLAAALGWWVNSLYGTLGRLMFPALAPLMLGLALGLEQLRPRLSGLVVVWLALLNMLAMVTVDTAYTPPPALAQIPPGFTPVGVQLGTLARLEAVRLPTNRPAPGTSATVEVCWRALQASAQPLTVFVQWVAPPDQVAARRETYHGLGRYPSHVWQPGHLFCDSYLFHLPADMPAPMRYTMLAGMFDLTTGARVPLAATPTETAITLGQVAVRGSQPPPAHAIPISQTLGERLELGAATWPAPRPGALWPLTLYWRARQPLDQDYTMFVHWFNAQGVLVAQADAPPRAGAYPTSAWASDEWLAETYAVPLPADLPPGAYQVQVGAYRTDTGERLFLPNGSSTIILETIHVQP